MRKLESLKQKLVALRDKALNVLKKGLVYAAEVAILLSFVGMVIYMAARAPEMHGYWLRGNVGSKVYMVKDNAMSGGGTGFAVKAPSGITYILTNDHVCEVSSDKQTVLIENNEGLSMRRRIIAQSDFTDLCLIEGVPGVEGLTVGSAPWIGQIVAAVGHPSLMPITISRGEVITKDDIIIPVGPISFVNPETGKEEPVPVEQGGVPAKECMKPKNRQLDVGIDMFFFVLKVKFCVNVTEDAYRTNMLIQPGSSGSPVVDFWGNVVGVAFAGDRAGWGIAVSQPDLVKFLKNY